MKLSKQAKVIIAILTLLSVYLYFSRVEVIEDNNRQEIDALTSKIKHLRSLKYESDKNYYFLKDSLKNLKKNLNNSKTKINEKSTIFFNSDFDNAFNILANRIQADSVRPRYKAVRNE